jgi:hypothetical protein
VIEVGKEVDVVEVWGSYGQLHGENGWGLRRTLEKERSYSAYSLSCIWLSNRGTIGGGVNSLVFRANNLCRGHFQMTRGKVEEG